MIKKYFTIIVVCFLFCPVLFAAEKSDVSEKNTLKAVCLGEVKPDKMTFVYRAKCYHLYNLFDTSYIAVTNLIDIGGSIIETDHETHISFKNSRQIAEGGRVYLKDIKAYMNPNPIYLGDLRTYSIKVSEEILIPVDALWMFFDMQYYQNIILAERRFNDFTHYVKVNQNDITNQSKYTLRLTLLHIIWDGKQFIHQYTSDIFLEPYQKIEWPLTKQADHSIYITTFLTEINGFKVDVSQKNFYGQKNSTLFKKYTDEIKKERLSKLFQPYRVYGIIKNDIGPFKKSDKVEIWRAEKNQYYVVRLISGKKMMLPCSSITIEGDKGVCNKAVAVQDIEDYVNIKGIESKTDFLIWTDIYRQRIYILKKSQQGWKLQKVFKCSSGRNVHLTPTGLFKLHYTIPYFGTQRNFRCKNAVVFYRDYMFHSILFDSTGKYVKAGKYQLGQRVSHGCVRLSEEDSAWLYRYMPLGTTVWIE